MTSTEKSAKEGLLAKYYTPGTPISIQEFLAGRTEQIRRVLDTINQLGQHSVIYGERGVGKTSLANIITSIAGIVSEEEKTFFAIRINCDKGDNFLSIWKKVFSRVSKSYPGVGFGQQKVRVETQPLATYLDEKAGTGEIINLLQTLPNSIIVLDEFDRIEETKVTTMIADSIKALSDFEIPVTIIVVGVADNISQLISEHASIERCITQIHMPRMLNPELETIITKRYPLTDMTFDSEVPSTIARLSQGFAHYTHTLGLHAGRTALDRDSSNVTKEDIKSAITKAVKNTMASIEEVYRTAVRSSHKDSLYEQVLLACALAEPDEFGFFSPPDAREPLSEIMGKKYEIPAFAGHLSKFCEDGRGKILERRGTKHRFKYRFSNPLMRPYIYLRGINNNKMPKKYSPL